MGRGFVIACAALALSACELVFGLDPAPRDGDPGGGDASADGGGGGGDGGDGGGTADADTCGSFDEDGDLIPDGCDPCPTAAPGGTDVDNDTLDAGCDPRPEDPDRIVAFYGFNQPLAADGWSVIYGGGAVTATVANGSLRIQTLGEGVLAIPGMTMPTAYSVEVRGAFGTAQSSKLAVFHDVNVNAANVGNGRWCYLAQSGNPMSYMGWQLLSDGEATSEAFNQVLTPAPLARFRLGAFRDGGDIGCRWEGAQALLTAVTFTPHQGPAVYALSGDFYIDWLVIYEHM